MATEIKNYIILSWGWPSGYVPVAGDGHARISLWDAANNCVGLIDFVDAGVSIPPDKLDAKGRIQIYLPSTMFHAIVDILRNEKPIYVFWLNNHGWLGTSEEPVGEEE